MSLEDIFTNGMNKEISPWNLTMLKVFDQYCYNCKRIIKSGQCNNCLEYYCSDCMSKCQSEYCQNCLDVCIDKSDIHIDRKYKGHFVTEHPDVTCSNCNKYILSSMYFCFQCGPSQDSIFCYECVNYCIKCEQISCFDHENHEKCNVCKDFYCDLLVCLSCTKDYCIYCQKQCDKCTINYCINCLDNQSICCLCKK